MKYKIQKKLNKQLIKQQTLILLLISIQNSLACIKNSNKTQIQICSNCQHLDMITNTLTITGNVVIQTNTINIYADKISVIYSNKNKREKIINAYGNPVIFYQFKNNKNQMLATSLYMSYKICNDTITLKGKVYLKKETYTLQSDCMIYLLKKKYVATCNNKQSFRKTKFTFNANKDHVNIHFPSPSSRLHQKHK